MFPTDTPSQARSTRSKRTRQVASNDDSVRQPLTKKRRSALQSNTFEPLTDANINQIAGREKHEVKMNGHATEPPKLHARTSSQPHELTLRGARRNDKKSERGGGQQTLSKNSFYTVAQLPCLPDSIRNHPQIPYSCVISPENDYILALGHTEAFIWPYNSSASSPSARDLITFKLPFPPASVGDPLPLAAFTARAASGEPGIVAVSPKWGKIVYWETITDASSSVPGQSSGVVGSVPKMLSGETVQELVKAEPAGFVITFSHGRVAHLTVRDQMGRPGIGVQFMRKSSNGSVGGGIFGSIRNVFTGDRRRGTPIVRAGKAAKAQRNVVVGTEDGEIEFWTANLSVGNTLNKTLNIQDNLLLQIQRQWSTSLPSSQLTVKVLDLDIVPTPTSGHELARRGDDESVPIVFLVSASDQQQTRYFILETIVTGEEVTFKQLHTLRCPSAGLSSSSDWRPRLCMSQSSAVVFVLFETAILMISIARIKESPSSQLLMEKSEPAERFQDLIQFQEDAVYRILGFAAEEVEGESSCVLAVQAFGIVRIVSHLREQEEVDIEDIESRVGPKSKIEQAIFFGTQRHNPLELNKPADEHFTSKEIEAAVLEISDDILNSNSNFLPKSVPSTDIQMKRRAKALGDLIYHALKNYSSSISRKARFQLLRNAEKLAAAQAIWKVQENIQKTYPRKDDREFTYLQFVLRAVHETRQKYPDVEKGETDHVRHWLINSVEHINHLMTELQTCIQHLADMDVRDPRILGDYLTEAVDIWVAGHETAFRFREDQAPAYGLGDEVFSSGVLQGPYPDDLPPPWTSTPETFRYGQRLIYDICNFLNEWWEHKPMANGTAKSKKSKSMPTDLDGKQYEAPSKKALLDLAARLPTEVELFSRTTQEESIQAEAQVKLENLAPKEEAAKIADIRGEYRPRLVQAITVISKFNMPGAIKLAEQMKDPGLLVELNKDYLNQLEEEAYRDPENRSLIENKIDEVQDHVETYYETFGNGWAFAHFSDMIASGHLGSMLAEAQQQTHRKQRYLNWFLKKSKSMGQQVGKISWINEILGEQRFDRAQKTLETVAVREETDIWSQKTQLCIAKLAGLAASEAAQESEQARVMAASEQAHKYDDSLALLELQKGLVTNVTASCSDAIDKKAARELALDTFAKRLVGKSSALRRILTAEIDLILSDHALPLPAMVDTLTLADPVVFAGLPEDDPDILDHEFAQALNAINLAASSPISDNSLSPADLDALRMLTWRRAMIRDDWLELNNSTGKSDQDNMNAMHSSSLFKTLLEVLRTYYDTVSGNAESVPHDAKSLDLKLFSPSDILSATSLLTPALIEKYLDLLHLDPASSEAKKFLHDLEKDLNKEQDRLRSFVDKGQLQMHWDGMVREGERNVRAWLGMQVDAEEGEEDTQGPEAVDGPEDIVPSIEAADEQ